LFTEDLIEALSVVSIKYPEENLLMTGDQRSIRFQQGIEFDKPGWETELRVRLHLHIQNLLLLSTISGS